MGENLSQRARYAFLDKGNALYFSAASYWEISIKLSLGKLQLTDDWSQAFDRLLIAQARFEEMTLLTADSRSQQYDIPTLW